MMTRVNKSRVGASVMLLAVLLLVSGTSVSAFAKENISAGQSGDPGDGLDFSSGGSTDNLLNGTGGASSPPAQAADMRTPNLFGLKIALVPYFDANGLHFVIVTNVGTRAESPK